MASRSRCGLLVHDVRAGGAPDRPLTEGLDGTQCGPGVRVDRCRRVPAAGMPGTAARAREGDGRSEFDEQWPLARRKGCRCLFLSCHHGTERPPISSLSHGPFTCPWTGRKATGSQPIPKTFGPPGKAQGWKGTVVLAVERLHGQTSNTVYSYSMPASHRIA